MRKIIITALGLSVIAVSTVQMAAAAERHQHARKVARAHASQQFRDANNSLSRTSQFDATQEFLLYHPGN
jgi:hypothetical protein